MTTIPSVFVDPQSAFTMDFRGMPVTTTDLEKMKPLLLRAHQGMLDIESGCIKNPDENRKVTHFTDRAVYLDSDLYKAVEKFASDIRSAKIIGSTGKPLTQVVINGIGGSALGPQLMQFAINGPYWNELSAAQRQQMPKIYFVDNTDSSGISDLLSFVDLSSTLIVTISKSGGTQETKNNMIGFQSAYQKEGLAFNLHAVAITMKGSQLDKIAHDEKWLAVFEMAESIGGRTSETSIVGHLPAALAGIDFSSFIQGAVAMDQWTRNENVMDNPAYFLATSWYIAGNGKGDRNMVIVPYSDRLILLSRYLQQLVMESLGKEFDLNGNVVHQGLSVFGNKGGTDAHAFIQQLNDGRDDFFAFFIEPLKDSKDIPVKNEISMGDYLHGFQSGLSTALKNRKRAVIQVQIRQVDTFNLGMLIALFERAVAFYAELIQINAFHQPGVQSYKLAAGSVIALTEKIYEQLSNCIGFNGTASQFSEKIGLKSTENDEIAGILSKLSENPERKLKGTLVSRQWNGTEWVFSIKNS